MIGIFQGYERLKEETDEKVIYADCRAGLGLMCVC